jgi:virginiamycin B lyase
VVWPSGADHVRIHVGMSRVVTGLRLMSGAAIAIAICGCSTAQSSQTGTIYWAQGPTGRPDERGSVSRANPDGSNVDRHFIDGTKGGAGVAVDGRHVYWSNYGSGTIGRANLDGSGVNQRFITRAEYPVGLAVDSHHIYWANNNALEADTIGRANLDGSGVNQRFITTTDTTNALGLAVDGEHIYWTDAFGDRIGRANLDGSEVSSDFITGANKPDGAAADDRYVYWSNSGDDTIGRANLDGSGVNQRCIAAKRVPLGNVPEGLAVDGRYVYWTNYPANSIGRANLDGTGIDERFIFVQGVPEGIAAAPSVRVRSRTVSQARCVSSKARILLGVRHFQASIYAVGWGEVAPPIISNGGASASGTISNIHWRRWGGKVAVGRGLNPIFKPQGGYYARPAVIELRASAVRRCTPDGPRVYTRLDDREPSKPGGPFGPWQTWASNMCGDQVSRPSGCSSTSTTQDESAHGTQLVSVKALPSGEPLSSRCVNTITATTDLAFAVIIKDTGNSVESRVEVRLTIEQTPTPLQQTQTLRLIEPGGQKTLVFRNLGQVQFATKTAVKVEIGAVPGERNTTNNSARYPVVFTLG